jgi:propanol-preferring alcohol dehydrogenase
MVLSEPRSGRLDEVELNDPAPGPGQVLIEIAACGVCRTDLHVVDGDLPAPKIPIIPGHEIVGTVVARAADVTRLEVGQRVGVAWLGHTCGTCRFCRRGRENLCNRARFTGYQIDGGYAQYTVADQRYAFPLGEQQSDAEIAPLLCAGLIGYRSLRMALEGACECESLGLYGFGAAAHIVCQVALHRELEVYAFTRRGDEAGQAFARRMGACWAGPSDAPAPVPLDAAIIFAPVGELVPQALRSVAPGGVVVCAGIHMSDIPRFPYAALWEERVLRSVANLTRRDAEEFLALAREIPVRTSISEYPLTRANDALDDLRYGRLSGAAVLLPG